MSEKVEIEFEQTFMFYLPRICEHCLNPSCAASCPRGAMYKRAEDGIVLVDQDRCRGWRMCVSGCPYKKVYFNHRPARPRSARCATRGSRWACRRCAPRRASGGCATSASCCTTPTGCSRRPPSRTSRNSTVAAHGVPRPARPRGRAAAARAGIPEDWIDAAQRRPIWRLISSTGSRFRCIPSTARCRWSGTSRRCPRSSTSWPTPAPTPRTPATCSRRSTSCAFPSSTSPTCSPPATRAGRRGAAQARGDALVHARHQPRPRPATTSIPAAVGMSGDEM